MRIAGLLLAAGRSTRFGTADKLAASLAGKPLIAHAADRMAALPLACRLVVGPVALPGFRSVAVPQGQGLSRSLHAGIAAAEGADALLVMLADMPLVPDAHLAAILARYRSPSSLVASSDGARPSPPALFGSQHFPALAATSGDHGARDLLGRAELVRAPPGALIDVDTADDLARAERLLAT